MLVKVLYFCAISLFSGHLLHGSPLDVVTGWFSGGSDEEVHVKEYPLSDKGSVEIAATRGNIMISTWNHPKVMVQASKNGTQEQIKETEISIKQSAGSLKISTNGSSAQTNYTIIIPKKASLETVISGEGDIKIKNTEGNVYASSHSGTIKLYNNIGTVRAHADSGNIKVKLNHSFRSSSSLLLNAAHGDVILEAPSSTNAQLDLKTHKGKVISDLLVTLDPQKTTLSSEAWKRMQKEIKGSLGSSGAPITIDVKNGDIELKERK